MEIAAEMPSVLGRLQSRLLDSTRDIVGEWASLIPQITAWEDTRLLDDPDPETLKSHKEVLDKCLALGWLLERATEQPDFPDWRLGEEVKAAIQVFREKREMFHGPKMPPIEAERILAQVFPEHEP